MHEDWAVIGQVMLQLVNDYFPVNGLNNYLSEFVTFKMKGHFPFGQLVILLTRCLMVSQKTSFKLPPLLSS